MVDRIGFLRVQPVSPAGSHSSSSHSSTGPEAFRLSFRIMGDEVDPEAVTARVGIAPDMAYRKGGIVQRSAPGREVRGRTGLWSVGTDTPADAPPAEQVAALTRRLRLDEPGTLDALREVTGDRDLFVYWLSRSRPRTADLPATLRALAGRLGARIDVDWYPAG